MGFYEKHCLPWVLQVACSLGPIEKQRQKVIPGARGRVLEVGIGSGLNLPHYDPSKVDKVIGLDPSAEMRAWAELEAAKVPFEVEFIGLSAEKIPLEDASVDTVAVTYTICTIPDPLPAIREMRRVLRPGGELIFTEHGAAPDPGVRTWQDRLNRPWGAIAGGCNMNRDVPELLREGGFEIRSMETMYLPGTPKILGFNTWGVAT